MKKNVVIIAATVAAIAVLTVGGYVVFHNSAKKPKSTKAAVQTTSPSANTDKANIVKSDTPAVTNSVLTTHSYAHIGQYLADVSGNTLYTYAKDTSGSSNCTGACLSAWPIYEDTGATTGLPTDVSTIKRADTGKTQYTYKGMPLYYYVGDSQGQVTGDGLNDFHAAKL